MIDWRGSNKQLSDDVERRARVDGRQGRRITKFTLNTRGSVSISSSILLFLLHVNLNLVLPQPSSPLPSRLRLPSVSSYFLSAAHRYFPRLARSVRVCIINLCLCAPSMRDPRSPPYSLERAFSQSQATTLTRCVYFLLYLFRSSTALGTLLYFFRQLHGRTTAV